MAKLKKSEIRQQKILEYMREMICEKGFPPTVRDICNALEIKSTSTVHSDIKVLEQKGLIKKDPNKPRALVLIENDEPVSPLRKQPDPPDRSPAPDDLNEISTVNVPVVGYIAAGQPILAEQNIEDEIPIPSRFLARGSNFILTVRGQSMINAGINDGDYILVQEDSDARNGEIVVAMVEGDYETEATVKTFYREDGHIRLQPENDSMKPIIVNDCRIVGKVKGVFRFFS